MSIYSKSCQYELDKLLGRADRFLRASLKGWRYVLYHPEELRFQSEC